jgi:hypothetical protein
MYLPVYVCKHIYRNKYIYICTNTELEYSNTTVYVPPTSDCAPTYVYKFMYRYTCVYKYMNKGICVYKYMNKGIYVHKYKYTYT